MRKHYFYFPFLVLLASCAANISYVGNTYGPTTKIDVFVDEATIKKNYDIIGKGYVRNSYITRPEQIQKKAIGKAKEKGADAILLKDYYVPAVATGLQTNTRGDSTGRTYSITGNAAIPVATSSEMIILFLKYREQ